MDTDTADADQPGTAISTDVDAGDPPAADDATSTEAVLPLPAGDPAESGDGLADPVADGAGLGDPVSSDGDPAEGTLADDGATVDPSPVAPAPTGAPPVDTSRPDRVVGTGTPASCTGAAVVAAVAAGGIITFDCGPEPVVITLTETAKMVNANGPEIVLDGGGLVTLSGGGQRRILYMNTCDEAQGWTTSHCQNQDHPRLTLQNLTFADGNATGETIEGGGGGAVFVRGGRLRVANSTFVRNRCDATGPDVGGAAIRVLSQYDGLPVVVTDSVFGGGPGLGGVCSNGGALSSIGVSWDIADSVFTHNEAIGAGANPARSGTPGGGSGGAIYLDGNTFTLTLRNSRIEDNTANEGGGAVFFVSNDRTGTAALLDSTLLRNPSAGFETAGLPGIFFLGAAAPDTTGSNLG